MFECKVCIERDKRIHDLQAQVHILQRLVFPGHFTTQSSLPIIDTETGVEIPVMELPPAPSEPVDDAVANEAQALLSGTY